MRKLHYLLCFFLFVSIAGKSNVNLEEPLPYIFDMVHDNPGEPATVSKYTDPAYLAEIGFTGMVPQWYLQCGVTYDTFEDGIVPEGSEAREWIMEKQAFVNAKLQEAKAAGIPVYAFTDLFVVPDYIRAKYESQLIGINGSKPDIHKPLTQELLRIQIREIFSTFPDLEGLVIRFGETYLQNAPYHWGNNPMTQDDAGEEGHVILLNILREEACEKLNKKIFYRTWDFGWLHTTKDRYERISNQIEPHENLVFSIKYSNGDFHRTTMFNTTLGAGKHPYIVEFQGQPEYTGKGAHPAYMFGGFLRDYEENNYSGGMEKLKEDEKFVGVWTWSRGGGWVGPYIQNELCCDINTQAALNWAKNRNLTEDEVLAVTLKSLGVKDNSINTFIELLKKAEEGVLKGHYTAYPNTGFDVWWTRDQFISGHASLSAMMERTARQRNDLNEEKVLGEKLRAVQIWKEIEQQAQSIELEDPADTEYIKVASTYGRILHEIYAEAFHIYYFMKVHELRNELGIDFDAYKSRLAASIEHNEALWAEFDKLLEDYPESCASLYEPNSFSQSGLVVTGNTSGGLAASVEQARLLLNIDYDKVLTGRTYHVIHNQTGNAVSIENASLEEGADVIHHPHDEEAMASRWTALGAETGMSFRNANSLHYLKVDPETVRAEGKLIQGKEEDDASKWTVQKNGNGYSLKNNAYPASRGFLTAAENQLSFARESNDTDQEWIMEKATPVVTEGKIAVLTNKATGETIGTWRLTESIERGFSGLYSIEQQRYMAADIKGDIHYQQTLMPLKDEQKWDLIAISGEANTYKLMNKQNSLCLGINGESALVMQYESTDDSQQWIFSWEDDADKPQQNKNWKIAYIVPGQDNFAVNTGFTHLPKRKDELLTGANPPAAETSITLPDPVFSYLHSRYTVEGIELTDWEDNEEDKAAIVETLSDYHAIVIREDAANSRNGVLGAIKNVNRPILNFQVYGLANGRAFGLSPNGEGHDGKGDENIQVVPEFENHPLFDNLEPDEDGNISIISDLALYKGDVSAHLNKSIQGLTSLQEGMGNVYANGADGTIASVIEIFPDKRASTYEIDEKALWLTLSINRNAYHAINDNGYVLISNAINYILSKTPPPLSVPDVKESPYKVRGGQNEIIITGAAGQDIYIYGIDGRRVAMDKGQETTCISVPKGLYIVKIAADRACKVSVR